MPNKIWLTVKEAADRVGVTEKTIRNNIKYGRLQAYRRGPRQIIIEQVDLDATFAPKRIEVDKP